jgi:tubulin polyglutamylase TTLL2
MNTSKPERPKPLAFKCGDSMPAILRQVLSEKGKFSSKIGWVEFDRKGINYWNLYWKGARFTLPELENCQEFQRMNHFSNSLVLTKKDNLFRMLRRLKALYGSAYSFFPESFCLPAEYKKFYREFQKDIADGRFTLWICKPVDMSRGRGICIIRHLHDLIYDSKYFMV